MVSTARVTRIKIASHLLLSDGEWVVIPEETPIWVDDDDRYANVEEKLQRYVPRGYELVQYDLDRWAK